MTLSLRNEFPLSAVLAVIMLLPVATRVIRRWLCFMRWPVTFDYGPTFLALHVRRLVEGRPLYGDFRGHPFRAPLVYGPVVPYLAAPLVRLFGVNPIAPLEAGRLLTICSTLAVALLIFHLGRRSGARAGAALLMAFAFLLSPLLEPSGFEFRVDMTALAVDLGGVALFEAGWTWPAAALLVVPFFIKQMRAAGMAAVVLYVLVGGDWAQALALAATWLVSVVLITFGLTRLWPYYWLNNYLALAAPYDLAAPVKMLNGGVLAHVAIFLLAGAAFVRRGAQLSVTKCFLIAALVFDTVMSVRTGAAMNYFLPTLAAASIVAAPELDKLIALSETRSRLLQVGFAGLIFWLAAGRLLGLESFWVSCDLARYRAWNPAAMEQLKAINGTVLTDNPDLVLIHASGDIQFVCLDVLRGMKNRGYYDDRPLLQEIEQHKIAAFALTPELLERSYGGVHWFWPKLRQAIISNYQLASRNGPPYLLLPKPSADR